MNGDASDTAKARKKSESIEVNAPKEALRNVRSLPKLGRAAFPILGVLALIFSIAYIAGSAFEDRRAYLEERNFRALERVSQSLSATAKSLAANSTLHFAPQNMHFSLSPRFKCLVGTTEVRGGGGTPYQFTYYMFDEPKTRAQKVFKDACMASSDPGSDIERRESTIESGHIKVTGQARISDLLWPMLNRPLGQSGRRHSGCSSFDVSAPERSIQECFAEQAEADLKDISFRRIVPDRQVANKQANDSLKAAFNADRITITSTTSLDSIDFEDGLLHFDAILLVGQDDKGKNRILYTVGPIPTAGETDDGLALDFVDLLNMVSDNGTDGAPEGTETAKNASEVSGEAFANLTKLEGLQNRVDQAGDAFVFRSNLSSDLDGCGTSSCQIVGIVNRGRYYNEVRQLDGFEATILLLATLVLFSAIPLIQLALRGPLDPLNRLNQAIVWFSVSMLSAVAALSVLFLWSFSGAGKAAERQASAFAEDLSDEFDSELVHILPSIANIAAQALQHDPNLLFC